MSDVDRNTGTSTPRSPSPVTPPPPQPRTPPRLTGRPLIYAFGLLALVVLVICAVVWS
ncbi:MAG TPA: hypothetical protein VFA12_07905 [Stellaceae bacterium]|nr:hypothetical protein [Stellaceae bacterium]